MRRTLTGMAVVAALTVCCSTAASAATVGWSIQAVPLPPGAANGYLPAVSCVSATNCTAVGARFKLTGKLSQVREAALAEHWNGSTWAVQDVPTPAGEGASVSLSGVSCASAASCTAVGDYVTKSGSYLTLAEHWNGSTWAIQDTPTPPGVAFVSLNGIQCTSAASCTAVGYYTTGITSGPGQALAEYWNGSSWAIQPTPPNPSGSYLSVLSAVSCTSSASCTAVGESLYVSSPTALSLAEQWNGSTWTILPTPAVPGSVSSALEGVSCTSAASCTAVGGYATGPDADLTLAEQWNGSTWAIQPTPALSGTDSGLSGISCTAANQCTAVGGYARGALAEHWNGSRWEQQQTTHPASHKLLYTASCTSALTCTAVGGFTPGGSVRSDQPLAERE